MATMDAVQIAEFGGPEVLQLKRLAIPEPRAGELLLKVRAASVNPVDYKIRSGKYPAVQADKLPYVLGRDACGEVTKLGQGVTNFATGDAVYSMVRVSGGGYAEYVILNEKDASRAPKTLDATSAAAVPLAALTAWQGLFRHGGLKPKQRVLIHGGSGGVGHFAIQFAKTRGAYVITTVSAQSLDFVLKLGADEAIDFKKVRFETQVHDVDVVFDLIGGETQTRSWDVLKKGGIVVSTVAAPSEDEARRRGVRGTRYMVEESGSELGEIAGLIDAGKVKPKVAKAFRLKEAAAAQTYLEQGNAQGKVVLAVE
jgi:NADPH:quinone reductase-like Zn-dependent oxidoreductase